MIKPEISILTPTRGRPDSVYRLIGSALATSPNLTIELIFYVDNDDPSRHTVQSYEGIFDEVRVIEGDRCVLSQMWNRCAEVAQADILMQCGDDIVFRTQCWDEFVVDRFDHCSDKILLVHGRDGFQDANLATHGFLHRRWIETVGYFVPPYFASDYNDAWLTEVADALGRRVFVPEIYTEHMHPVCGKGPMDRTHQERLARHSQLNVDQLWRDTKHLRQADVAKLRKVTQ